MKYIQGEEHNYPHYPKVKLMIKPEGIHNIIREIKDGYNELGMIYTKDNILSVLVSVYGFRADQLVGVKL
jgi:hypothetical protein|tara:strand:+ start:188 stop:397 length:210 start_codon:yes stop_codon:yes gene_type:complete